MRTLICSSRGSSALPVSLPFQQQAVCGNFLFQARFDPKKNLILVVLLLHVMTNLAQLFLTPGDDLLHVLKCSSVVIPSVSQGVFQHVFLMGQIIPRP